MSRQKLSEVSTGSRIDNIFIFHSREDELLIEAKNVLALKSCGVTKSCINSMKNNPFNCEGFENCNSEKELLKLFL